MTEEASLFDPRIGKNLESSTAASQPDNPAAGDTDANSPAAEIDEADLPLRDLRQHINTAWTKHRNDNTKWQPLIGYLAHKYGVSPGEFGAKLITQDKQRGNRILKELPRESNELRYVFISCAKDVDVGKVVADVKRAALPKLERAVIFRELEPVRVVKFRSADA